MADRFPILQSTSEIVRRAVRACGPPIESIPWAMIAPHERQAMVNHDQTLKRLAERGGLSMCEALAVLDDRAWRDMPIAEAYAQLTARVQELETQEATRANDHR